MGDQEIWRLGVMWKMMSERWHCMEFLDILLLDCVKSGTKGSRATLRVAMYNNCNETMIVWSSKVWRVKGSIYSSRMAKEGY